MQLALFHARERKSTGFELVSWSELAEAGYSGVDRLLSVLGRLPAAPAGNTLRPLSDGHLGPKPHTSRKPGIGTGKQNQIGSINATLLQAAPRLCSELAEAHPHGASLLES